MTTVMIVGSAAVAGACVKTVTDKSMNTARPMGLVILLASKVMDVRLCYCCALTQTATSGLSAALGTMPQETDDSLKTVGARRDGPQ